MTAEKKENGLILSLFTRQNLNKIILICVIFLSFLISFICYLAKSYKRYTFVFPSVVSGEYIIEYRNLSKKAEQGSVQYFIDELLLGSQIERTKKIFIPGTRVLSCFQRDNVLYLNLSDDLLKADDTVIDIKTGIQLLDKNIKKNFSKIETVEVFVDGKIAFEK